MSDRLVSRTENRSPKRQPAKLGHAENRRYRCLLLSNTGDAPLCFSSDEMEFVAIAEKHAPRHHMAGSHGYFKRAPVGNAEKPQYVVFRN